MIAVVLVLIGLGILLYSTYAVESDLAPWGALLAIITILIGLYLA